MYIVWQKLQPKWPFKRDTDALVNATAIDVKTMQKKEIMQTWKNVKDV